MTERRDFADLVEVLARCCLRRTGRCDGRHGASPQFATDSRSLPHFMLHRNMNPPGLARHPQLEGAFVHRSGRAFTDSLINLSYASLSVLSCILNCIGTWRRVARARAVREDTVVGIESIIVMLIVGAIAGWLAGLIVRGFGFGLVWNIVIGIVGAIIGVWLLTQLGVMPGSGFIGSIVNAVIGAVVLLVIVGFIKR